MQLPIVYPHLRLESKRVNRYSRSCVACQGRGDFHHQETPENGDGYGFQAEYYSDCLLCDGTGYDDPLLYGIMSGELMAPQQEAG